MNSDWDKILSVFKNAEDSGRYSLYEFEVYEILSALKLGIPPKYSVIKSPDYAQKSIDEIPGDKLVLKIVHPRIAHKSDIGGVKIVSRSEAAEKAREIFDEVPKNYASLLIEKKEIPDEFSGLSEEELADRIKSETYGVLVSEYIDAPHGFGEELFIGMRDTREFGPIVNFGLGGIDTELYAREMRPGRAVAISALDTRGIRLAMPCFSNTVSYEILVGLTRGHKKSISGEALDDALKLFNRFVWAYSVHNPKAQFWLTECEINPFLIVDRNLVPIDGLLRFKPVETKPPQPPVEKIHNLLEPKDILLIGVSVKSTNIGRVILGNLLRNKFDLNRLAILKDDAEEIDGVKCFPKISDLPIKFDLVVLSVPAEQVPDIVSELIEHDKAESIILITGGMGEKEGKKDIENRLKNVIIESRIRPDKGPVMVGGNSLGIISGPGGYDTMFVPETKLPKNPDLPIGKKIALISQSGAFMITRMSKLGGILPRYAISTGNQVDLGIADFLWHFLRDKEVKVIGCYIEGFKDGEGMRFADAVQGISEQDIVVYKAGRSAEGRKAASGHTAALAGDWNVADAVLKQAGCIVAHTFDEWTDLLMLCSMLSGHRASSNRLAVISNAGYETVGMADNLRSPDYKFEFSDISDTTRVKLDDILKKFRLNGLVDIRNPMDLTPMAVDAAHVEILQAFASEPDVDLILHACVPLSPVMRTREKGGPDGDGIEDPKSFASLVIEASRNIHKPLVLIVDSGKLYDPMVEMLMNAGIPVFRSADRAIRTLGLWAKNKFGGPV